LILKDISLHQFKNYGQAGFRFDQPVVAICGPNGVGKTNLLDAIYYLCFTKSYFAKSDQQNVQFGGAGFRIDGEFDVLGIAQRAVCILRETGKKEFSLQGEAYDKFAAHIGKLPAVVIAPDDVQIITGGSEDRRRFLDALLCQLDPRYLENLMEYNKIVQQRNSFLRAFSEKRILDNSLIEVYDQQLLEPGVYVYEQRRAFLRDLLPLVKAWYIKISASDEQVGLVYQSQLLHGSFKELLQQSRDRDLVLQRTTVGVHKDDIGLELQHQPFKSVASQGQRKSLLFALKLAEYAMLKQAKGFTPLLLLDDVFEKLDEARMRSLLSWVGLPGDGQIFITDTHPERIRKHLDQIPVCYQLIELH
jgi:DNA replication and repair protein RecF